MKRVACKAVRLSFSTAVCSAIMISLALVMLLSGSVQAAGVDIEQAKAVVQGWLGVNPRPLGTVLGQTIADAQVFTDDNDCILYYVMYLEPRGFVIVSADDAIEPIIAFCGAGEYDPSEDNPLGALVNSDMAARMEFARSRRLKATTAATSRSKWVCLQLLASERDEGSVVSGQEIPMMGPTSVSDLRVVPLTESKWSQKDEGGQYCYNYYTPNHYPTGCVATAMAQLMRYHRHPTEGIGVRSFQIKVNGATQNRSTMGGNGAGGAYQWDDMPLDPDPSTTDPERQSIGALCYDAGLSVNMSYTADYSSASSYDAKDALIDVFGYSGGVYAYNSGNNIGSGLNGMINPNLDAGLPVMLSLERTGGGHLVLADGYGYDNSTLYHHLNMGWGGSYDAWYALPLVDAYYTYTSITGCVYNIYTSGSGEIVSGRVLDMVSNPIVGATVTAKVGGTTVEQTSTDAEGIYALTNLGSNTSFTIAASKEGHAFSQQYVSTGRSFDEQRTSGNVWGIDFVSQSATPPTAYNKTVSALSGTAETVTLDATDEGYPDPPGQLSYTVTSLPEHGILTDPQAGEIAEVPYMLRGNGNTVEYLPCAYFTGEDRLEFVADDGGTAPLGGESNTATVTMEVDNHIYTTYEPTTNSLASWPFWTSYHDCRTQVIYLASEIGGGKSITDLSLNIYQAPGQSLNNWTIRMKHTGQSEYQGLPQLETSGWTVVYQADEATTPIGWRKFSFQRPFEYNGTDNVLVDFSFNNSSSASDGSCFVSDTGKTRVVMVRSNSGHGSPLDWTIYTVGSYAIATAVPNLKLTGEVSADPLVGDFGLDCGVDFRDFATLASAWLSSTGQVSFDERCDISESKDGVINNLDLGVFAENWLATYE